MVTNKRSKGKLVVDVTPPTPAYGALSWFGEPFVLAPSVTPPLSSSASEGELKLDIDLDLSRECASFYVLAVAEAYGAEEATAPLDKLSAYLAEQLARYLELACLGEARHTFGRHKAKHVQGSRGALYKEFCRQLASDALNIDRKRLWSKWDAYFGRYGRQLHVWLVQMFNLEGWGGAYGGGKWAVCMQVALSYRRGRLSNRMFCDAAFGLQHNGNIAYDKLWSVKNVGDVLEAKRHGKYSMFWDMADPAWKELAIAAGVPPTEGV